MVTEGPIQVAAGADDADERDDGTGFSSTNSFVKFNAHTSASIRRNAGAKFDSVDIAGGDTIDDVDLEFYMHFSGDSFQCDILANDVDNAADFSTEADVTSRIRTTALAAWVSLNVPAGFRASSTDDSVDATAVVQEVIDRGGWASGNDMVLLVDGHNTTFDYCDARSYDFGASTAPRLTIDYTVGGGPPAALAARRLLIGTGR